MAIRIRHLEEISLQFHKVGAAAVGKVGLWRAPFDGRIKNVRMRVGTAGVTGSQIGDVTVNGVSIFATSGNKPTLTTGTDTEVPHTLIDGPRTFKEGDLIAVEIDQIHTTAAQDTVFDVIVAQHLASVGVITG